MAGTNKKNTLIKSAPCIILKDPQLPENIGMCARSMFNYGFSDLRIINPKNAWPSEKAMSSSHVVGPGTTTMKSELFSLAQPESFMRWLGLFVRLLIIA